MTIGDISIIFIVHFVLWILGFLLLLRISYCRVSVHRNTHKPSVSVIIPARNEEHTLPNLLNSLSGQLSSQDEVIVVDDHSEDRTKEVAKNSGVKVLESLPTPEGWVGKTWACSQGASIASGEIFVFLDADTVLDNNGLKSIIETYNEKDGVLSIQPYHKMRDLYEQLSAFFNIIVMAGIGAFSVLGRRIKPIGLFGPVVVMKRQYYLDSGGHDKVKGEILDDVAFGSELQKKGVQVHCLGGKNTISFRMYPNGIRELINGWSKGFAMGAAKTSTPLLILIVFWIAGSIGTTRSLIEAIAATNNVQIAISGGLHILYALQIYWMLVRIGNFKFYTALFYPIPMAFFVMVFTYSFVRIFIARNVQWKGRKVDLKRKVNR
ncbi:MAG TPA: glycosyltransferase family 2 protein [Dehalococcoidia bacterium]|nr:glycosyltransferase family 2 protein [Dehalococcoidia bacterium]